MRRRDAPAAAPVAASVAPPVATLEPPRLPITPRTTVLPSGLEVCLLEDHSTPLVVTALCYRAGARDETPERAGVAHLLEHMMFKGSGAYPEGAIDRLTRSLGGANNAFTSHDATVYHFGFASDRWVEALAIEADRMAGLALAPAAIESERRVVLEELAQLADHPWEALALAVAAELWGDHPYGRSVLGSVASLEATTRDDLEAFHAHHYRPGNAVLVLAGDVDERALERAAALFPTDGGAPDRPAPSPAPPPAGLRRVEIARGEVDRLLVALPAPAAADPDHPKICLLATVLGVGRASRLHDELVDTAELASAVWVELAESQGPGSLSVAVELAPGADPDEVETRVLAALERLAAAPPREEELERARRMVAADWIFGVETLDELAFVVAEAAALFDLGWPERWLAEMAGATAGEVAEAAGRWLRAERDAVVGWARCERR